jgi:hypothetical protein
LIFLDLCDNSFFNTFLKFYVIHSMCDSFFFLGDKEMKLCDKNHHPKRNST